MVKIEKIKAKVLETGRISPLINYTNSKIQASCVIKAPNGMDMYKQLVDGKVLDLISNAKKPIEGEISLEITEENITKVLDKIYDRASEISNEQGVDALYIAIGFIEWKDRDENPMNSPLLLVPVKFIKRTRAKKEGLNGYQLALREEETSFNISLLQKFKEEKITIEIEDFKPETDIVEYFEKINIEISKTNFKVTPTCVLGIFYNPRINIYRDLTENEEKVVNHPIVMAINGDQSKIPPLDHSQEDKFDGEISYKKNFTVISCDASQLKAINETALNHSLVIEGPPGTGKSQTITNIISTALSNDKKVLFVAEKKAALNVVYKNLKRVNLDDFCLFFDSNKADRKAVFRNLYETAMKNPTLLKEEVFPILDSLDNLKDYFDIYHDQIHKIINPLGMSLYEIIGKYVSYMDYDYISSHIENPLSISNKELEDRIEFLRRFNAYLDQLGIDDYRKHLFYGYKNISLSLKEKELILQILRDLEKIGINPAILDISDLSISALEKIMDLAVNKAKYINSSWLIKTNIINYFNLLKEYHEKKIIYDKNLEELKAYFILDILQPKVVNSLHKMPQEVNAMNIKLYGKDIKANLKILKGYLLKKSKLSKENVIAFTNMIHKTYELNVYLEGSKDILAKVAGKENPDFDTLFIEVEKVDALLKEVDTLPEKCVDMIIKEEVEKDYPEIKKYIDILYELISKLNAFYNIDIIDYIHLPLKDLFGRLEGFTAQIDSLGVYTSLMQEIEKYRSTNIIEFINELLDKNLERKKICELYYRDFYTLMLDRIMEEHEIVKEFSSIKQANSLHKFIKEDDIYNLISIAKIREIASNKRPNPNNASTVSDVGILKTQKEKPTMYIKALFKQIEKSLLRIKPIMLMSPLAVSTYLPSDIKFDMVIFDEASQIQPEDALCAIYRAKQVVVVGDSEQLPPTDFFKKMSTIEAGEDEMEGEETDLFGNSLLDLCKTFLESIRLKWHYRSRNEELITFSNHYIYNDELVTFPSSHTNYPDEGIEFIPTYNGIYGRGESRTNKVEADKVAELVIETTLKYPKRSLGVVSFSLAQKNEIMNSLHTKLSEIKKSDNEKYLYIAKELFDESKDEPFFVKNLENVQGDERDVIIFSICYGKDKEDGELFYNLGKLTRDEGRKRINVAVSRSKINMKVVCSFDPDLIHISNEQQTGLIAMKNFLQYAKHKTIVKSPKDNLTAIIQDYVADDIKKKLEAMGYKVVKNIGESKFKVELGVLMPDKPTDYVLGIILDGESYKNCQSVRDREKLRALVLNRLGWNIYSVWASDYFKNRELVIKQVVSCIEDCIKSNHNIFNSSKPELECTLGNFEKEVVDRGIRVESYKEVEYDELLKRAPEDYNGKFKFIVTEIVSQEGPIHLVDLASKMIKFFDATSVSENLIELIKERIEELGLLDILEIKNNFYYLKGKHSFYFRRSNKKRTITGIYYLELIDIMYKIIDNSSGIDHGLLYKEISRYCNYAEDSKFTNNELEYLNQIFEKLLLAEKIEVIGSLIYTK